MKWVTVDKETARDLWRCDVVIQCKSDRSDWKSWEGKYFPPPILYECYSSLQFRVAVE